MFDDLDRLIQGDPFAKTSLHPALQLKRGRAARSFSSLTLAQELKNTEFILQAQTLSHRVNFLVAEVDSARAAVADALAALLEQTESDEAKAEIHYELAAVHRALSSPDEAEHHRQEALRLYESLYTKIPKQTFKKRAEELAGNLREGKRREDGVRRVDSKP